MANKNDITSYPRFYELAASRYSCRNYKPVAVERDVLAAVVDAARLAPSACNRQPWFFVVIDNDGPQHDAILKAYDREWIATAPAYIVACGNHSEAWHRQNDGKDHTDIDVAIAVEHICLAAAAIGLQTCWVCNFDAPIVAKAIDAPEGVEPIAIIPIGYPADDAVVPEKKRKTTDEILRWGKF